MLSLLTASLFIAAFCLAIAVCVQSWRAFGPAALALRQQLAACDPLRELRFVRITTLVKAEAADLWRPGFRPLERLPRRPHHYSGRPLLRPALRAA